ADRRRRGRPGPAGDPVRRPPGHPAADLRLLPAGDPGRRGERRSGVWGGRDPPAWASGRMLPGAAVGLVANAVSMWLLRDGQRTSLNMRGAYLEVWGDLLGSVAGLAAAVVIALTGFRAADPIASAVIAVAILPRTWRLLREAVDVLLEAAPKGVDLAEVRRHLVETPGATDVHDLHAWTITSGLPVLSVHVVLERDADAGKVLDGLGACLAGHFD